jgi:hypothetical protein
VLYDYGEGFQRPTGRLIHHLIWKMLAFKGDDEVSVQLACIRRRGHSLLWGRMQDSPAMTTRRDSALFVVSIIVRMRSRYPSQTSIYFFFMLREREEVSMRGMMS